MAFRPTTKVSSCPSLQFTRMNNLSRGSTILFATDDFFAEAENLLKDTEPEWKEGVYTPEGKWMDGWETRRKRIPGHDYCLIKLECPSVIYGFECDTSFFTGNFTPCVSIQAARLSQSEENWIPSRKGVRGVAASAEDMKKVERINAQKWTTLVGKTRLGAGYADTCHNYMSVENREVWTHVRLNYFPDGGVARFRIFGRVEKNLQDILSISPDQNGFVDLVAMKNGGYCIGLSDAHYGHPRNLILDGKTRNISDGWETARKLQRPEALAEDDNGNLDMYGFEWAAFRLGVPGAVYRVDVDTAAFKGNYPYACKVEGCFVNQDDEQVQGEMACVGAGFEQQKNSPWRTLLNMTMLEPDRNHTFSSSSLEKIGPISHVRVTIYPDGGLAKLRVWGVPSLLWES
ncbi:Allantoicase [Orchesella cincta]|uniref:Allantoate amidinohydrolase n=1 Tax=Orchesella cincta TaxID=48709 RepID=A0A1D2MYV8_ORCCI|nr:Allantoicase [Orchesella cincta]